MFTTFSFQSPATLSAKLPQYNKQSELLLEINHLHQQISILKLSLKKKEEQVLIMKNLPSAEEALATDGRIKQLKQELQNKSDEKAAAEKLLQEKIVENEFLQKKNTELEYVLKNSQYVIYVM